MTNPGCGERARWGLGTKRPACRYGLDPAPDLSFVAQIFVAKFLFEIGFFRFDHAFCRIIASGRTTSGAASALGKKLAVQKKLNASPSAIVAAKIKGGRVITSGGCLAPL